MKKQVAIKATLVAATAAVMMLTPTVANAVEDTAPAISAEQSAALEEALLSDGIDAVTVDALITKVESGQPLDVWTDAEPVSSATADLDGFTEITETYADGSVAITTVQVPEAVDPNAPVPMADVRCTIPDGPYPFGWTFSGCEVARGGGGLSMSFYVSGRTSGQSQSAALISGVTPLECTMVGGDVKTKDSYIVTASAPTAVAIGSCSYSLGLAGTYTQGIEVRVTSVISAIDR